jgi:TetR/AcrR family transcriptional regulator, mexJK operon transcriptional repressor
MSAGHLIAAPPYSAPHRASVSARSYRGSRRRILSAARTLFLERSYADVSTDLIACTAGVSKSTLYAHFGSKEDLFTAIMDSEIAALAARTRRCSAAVGDVRTMLTRVGRDCLDLLLSPEAIALHRTAVSIAPKLPEIARRYHELGPKPLVDLVAAILTRGQAKGQLRMSDPEIAAMHFLTLIQGDLVLRRSLAVTIPTREEREGSIGAGLRVFLAAYGARSWVC